MTDIAALIERNKDRIARIRNGGWAYEPVMELLQANIDALSRLTTPPLPDDEIKAIAGLIKQNEEAVSHLVGHMDTRKTLHGMSAAALRALEREVERQIADVKTWIRRHLIASERIRELEAERDAYQHYAGTIKRKTIEECAQVAYGYRPGDYLAKNIAEAIRALAHSEPVDAPQP